MFEGIIEELTKEKP